MEALALAYAARFATSRARLEAYLARKIRERGWSTDGSPDIPALVERLVALGYVDDAGYASAKGASLGRRGYGTRRLAESLRAAGIAPEDGAAAMAAARAARFEAAERFARKRRIGPFAERPAAREERPKRIAAFLRAGHDMATAAAWVDARPGEPPDAPAQDMVDEME